ncbi:MAG TPA: hypothetical protein PK133_07680, partial [Ferruginibacter sp.]|nr:hypothetical protein [Ferruginibacter sp.]
MTALTAIITIAFIACQKEIKPDSVQTDLNKSALKPNIDNEKNTKKERKILFVSNRDGNDEVY